ncbi:MAG: hypothetical protein QE570_19605 [Verrucomicrobiota bacterium]|nr:hypothetical protein [Verrucomicrobiota bacterium]
MTPPPRVLLAVRLETQFREMARVAQLLRNSGMFAPCFYFDQARGESLSRMQAVCRDLDVAFEPVEATAASKGAQPATKPSPQTVGVKPRKRRFHLRIPLLWHVMRLTKMVPRRRLELRHARESLLQLGPVLLAVPEDGVGGPLHLISAARSLGIPVLVIPYEFSTLKQPVQAIRNDQAYKEYVIEGFLKQWVARRHPSWALAWEHERLLRLPLPYVLSLEHLKMAPPQPWAVHGGQASCLAVESPAMERNYIALGLPREKLVLTGALSDDNLYQHRQRRDEARRALFQEMGWPENDLFLLCALPPDYTTKQGACFSNYEELLIFWINALSRLHRFKVLYQLHPAVNDAQRNFIASLGASVTKQDPAALIPCCDVLVTSVSSIIRWAIACGKPVINFDVYRFGYTDYAGVPGVRTIDGSAAFEAELAELAPASDHLDNLKQMQHTASKDWGMLDGRSGTRMLEVMCKLTQAPHHSRAERIL